jgi:hypothetical protein
MSTKRQRRPAAVSSSSMLFRTAYRGYNEAQLALGGESVLPARFEVYPDGSFRISVYKGATKRKRAIRKGW